MLRNTLKKIGTIVIIFLLFLNNCYAEDIKNEEVLRDYVSKGFNEKQLEERYALLRFQAENNIIVNPVIEKDTEKALSETEKVILDTIPEEMRKLEWFIVINKTKKILTVYNKGEIYKKYPVALGKSKTPTPDYKFTIINKAKNPRWGGMGGRYRPVKGGASNNPLGKRWLGLSTEKHRGYGIHGNSSPYSIGQYVSHGCIRMINEDVEELYEYIPVKTKVWIGTEEILKEWGIEQYIQYEEIEEVCDSLT
ncbi:L,D-transpeptidase [Anaerosalibacter sp. Marseille-P3206]|uniref:L,D-transpeptidase n=1 Tax=Anaerosalibacter sp. Marseille-P3206 TaxID=1871005 RepID=UPI000984CD8A|nr:L,D-transpeptidase [Anaerosalibacter sp. Marseille-P3206]